MAWTWPGTRPPAVGRRYPRFRSPPCLSTALVWTGYQLVALVDEAAREQPAGHPRLLAVALTPA